MLDLNIKLTPAVKYKLFPGTITELLYFLCNYSFIAKSREMSFIILTKD